MAFHWNFNKNDVEKFPIIPAGDHRCRIRKVEETQSRNTGNDMYVVDLECSGQVGTLRYWLVLDPQNTTRTNTNLARFWECFDIPEGILDGAAWIGKTGACRVRQEPDNNGEVRARVSHFLDRRRQEALPPWQEPKGHRADAAPPSWVPLASDDLPLPEDDNVPF